MQRLSGRAAIVLGCFSLLWAGVTTGGETGAAGGFVDERGSAESADPLGPPGTGRATLIWTAPERRKNGECIGGLDGFVVMWGPLRSRLDRQVELSLAEAGCRTTGQDGECGPERVCEYTVEDLGPIKWYFSIRAVDKQGRMGAPSETVFMDVD